MGLRVVLSGRFKDILGAFGGRFDGEIAVGVSADDTVDHVVIVIGMMVKQTILHNPTPCGKEMSVAPLTILAAREENASLASSCFRLL